MDPAGERDLMSVYISVASDRIGRMSSLIRSMLPVCCPLASF